MCLFQSFLRNEAGVTAIEYALIASLIAVFIIAAVEFTGTKVSTVFGEVGSALK
jgi:pilus assembly protein Flp/PilA